MAAEPKPVHVPREPKRNVLVETRKELSRHKLPFNHSVA
jgi:hypothetical protein